MSNKLLNDVEELIDEDWSKLVEKNRKRKAFKRKITIGSERRFISYDYFCDIIKRIVYRYTNRREKIEEYYRDLENLVSFAFDFIGESSEHHSKGFSRLWDIMSSYNSVSEYYKCMYCNRTFNIFLEKEKITFHLHPIDEDELTFGRETIFCPKCGKEFVVINGNTNLISIVEVKMEDVENDKIKRERYKNI